MGGCPWQTLRVDSDRFLRVAPDASESIMRGPACRTLRDASVLVLCVSLLLCLPSSTGAASIQVLDFDDLPTGVVLTKQVPGVHVSATNPHADAPDAALVWDFTGRPDLAYGGQQHDGGWSGGNVADFNTLGKGLVVAGPDPGKLLEPRRPAGDLIFKFDEKITSFGFSVVDVEGPEEFITDTGYFVRFAHAGQTLMEIDFVDFITPGSPYYDPTIEFGHHTANRINPISAEKLGTWAFDEVEIALGGSAVVGRVRYEAIPTPTALLGGMSLLALSTMRRRKS